MDGAAIGSSSMKLDRKRVPHTARPLRQAWRLHIRATPVRCPADFQEPRIWGVCMIAGGKGCYRQLSVNTQPDGLLSANANVRESVVMTMGRRYEMKPTFKRLSPGRGPTD
jgi:hypothetical protein